MFDLSMQTDCRLLRVFVAIDAADDPDAPESRQVTLTNCGRLSESWWPGNAAVILVRLKVQSS
jgi:hypothetical protein